MTTPVSDAATVAATEQEERNQNKIKIDLKMLEACKEAYKVRMENRSAANKSMEKFRSSIIRERRVQLKNPTLEQMKDLVAECSMKGKLPQLKSLEEEISQLEQEMVEIHIKIKNLGGEISDEEEEEVGEEEEERGDEDQDFEEEMELEQP